MKSVVVKRADVVVRVVDVVVVVVWIEEKIKMDETSFCIV
jgi:hypothetical protein